MESCYETGAKWIAFKSEVLDDDIWRKSSWSKILEFIFEIDSFALRLNSFNFWLTDRENKYSIKITHDIRQQAWYRLRRENGADAQRTDNEEEVGLLSGQQLSSG